MARVRKLLPGRPYALLLALAIMMAVFSVASPYFMSVPNMLNIARAASIAGITCAGISLAIIAGMIDLSIAATTNLSLVVVGLAVLKLGINPWLAMAGGLLVGVVVGVCNGLLITKVRINPLIATLGTMGIATGIAFLLTNGVSTGMTDPAFSMLGRSFVMGVPTPVVVLIGVYVLTFLVLRYTQFGRAVYAVGGNPVAARLAGINVDRWRILIMIWCAFWAAFSGLVLFEAGHDDSQRCRRHRAEHHRRGHPGWHEPGRRRRLHTGHAGRHPHPDDPAERPGDAERKRLLAADCQWCALLLAVGIDQLRTGGYK